MIGFEAPRRPGDRHMANVISGEANGVVPGYAARTKLEGP